MKIKHFILIAAIPAMASCSQNEITDRSPEANPPIGFSVYTGAQTRGTVTDDAALKQSGFGVYAYSTDNTPWTGTTEVPNFMNNQGVLYSGGKWTYSPLRFWPGNNADKVTFFAYAPYESVPETGAATGIKVTGVKGGPKFEFTISPTADKMVDFVVAEPLRDRTSDGGPVAFKFKHLLSRVNMVVDAPSTLASDTYIVVKSVKIVGQHSNSESRFWTEGTYDNGGDWRSAGYPKQEDYDLGPVLNTSAVSLPEYNYTGVEIDTGDVAIPLFKNGHYLFLLPVGILGENYISLKISYDVVSPDASDPMNKTVVDHVEDKLVSLPAGSKLEMGKAYKYTLTIAPNEIRVSGTAEEGWGTETNTDVPIPPLYNGEPAHLLKVPGGTPYWVAPEDAGSSVNGSDINFSTICPKGWHVPTKDEFAAMTGIITIGSWVDTNYDAIKAVFPASNFYWSSTQSGPNALWGLFVITDGTSRINTSPKTDTNQVRCVRKVGE